MSAGSSEPPLERVLTLRGPMTRERPYSDTVWYAREEHRLISSEAPVEICKTSPRVMHGILWRVHHKTKCWPQQSWTAASRILCPSDTPAVGVCSTELNVAPEYCMTLCLVSAQERGADIRVCVRSLQVIFIIITPMIGTLMER